MVFEKINEFLDAVGTSRWQGGYSSSQIDIVFYGAIAILVICVFLMLYISYHKKKGSFTHPKAKAKSHCEDIAGLVKYYMNIIYDRYADAALRKNMDIYRNSAPSRIQIHADTINGHYRRTNLTTWNFYPNKAKDVIAGNFGRVFVNRYFFTLRSSHHRLAMHLAAELIYIQLLAVSGQDISKIIPKPGMLHLPFELGKINHIEDGGKAVLAKAGLLEEAGALDDKNSVKISISGQKIDDKIARALYLDEKEAKQISEEMRRHWKEVGVVTTAKVTKDKWKGLSQHSRKILVMLGHEIKHTNQLVSLMKERDANIRSLIGAQKIKGGALAKWQEILGRWEHEIPHMETIRNALMTIRDNESKWANNPSYLDHFQRLKEASVGDAAHKLDKQAGNAVAEKGRVMIGRVEAILTSLTESRARIIKEIYYTETVT